MDVEQPGDIRRRLLLGTYQLDDLLLLVRFEFRTATANMPLLACSLRPLRVRSRSIARSNSAKEPTICIIKPFPRDCCFLLTV
jgi:hypothetical protein